MGLTEEQKKLIQEKRLQALQLRAAKHQSAPSTTQPTPRPPPQQKSLQSQRSYRPKSSKLSSTDVAEQISNDGSMQGGNSVKSGKCFLINRDRFAVDVSYSAPLIQLFKSMDTGQYDPATKKWSFDLSEYHDLVQGLPALTNTVRIKRLPLCVLLTFDDVVRGRTSSQNFIPEVDLSCIDAPLADTLLPFQREAVNFGVYRNGRLLIADDMGLGKSLQALALAAYYRSEWPLLVVCPSSVRFAWREHVLKWLPSVEPQDINVVVSGRDPLTSGKVNIISYDLMARRVKDMDAVKVIIMDESHFLKNIKAARTKAAVTLLKAARRVILLSGTPALSRPQELFTQISSVDHKVFPKFMDYGLRYCDAKQMQWGWDYSGSSNLHELQLVLEERIMIRRLKKDVMSQLPAKFRTMIVLDPGSLKKSQDIKASQTVFQKAKGSERQGALLQYFHETASVKSKAVTDYIMDLLEADRKLLVFAHHKEVLDALEHAVSQKYAYIRIDGRTPSEARDSLAHNFQTNDSVRVAILSITAANAGLHLTAANLVVFAELFWNPGILAQAEDRVHRIGQEDSVTIQYLVARGTADDCLWPLIQNKLDVLNKAGLSKDTMNMDTTTLLKDPIQPTLLDIFGNREIDDAVLSTIDSSAQSECGAQPSPLKKPDKQSAETSQGIMNKADSRKKFVSPLKRPYRQSPSKSLKNQPSILNYLSPTKKLKLEETQAPPTLSSNSQPANQGAAFKNSNFELTNQGEALKDSNPESTNQNAALEGSDDDWLEDDGVDELLMSLEPMDDL